MQQHAMKDRPDVFLPELIQHFLALDFWRQLHVVHVGVVFASIGHDGVPNSTLGLQRLQMLMLALPAAESHAGDLVSLLQLSSQEGSGQHTR